MNKEHIAEFWTGFRNGPKELLLGLETWWNGLDPLDRFNVAAMIIVVVIMLCLTFIGLSIPPRNIDCSSGPYKVQKIQRPPLNPFGSYQFSAPEVHVLYQKKPWKDTYDPVLLMTKEEAEQTCAEWIEPTGPPF